MSICGVHAKEEHILKENYEETGISLCIRVLITLQRLRMVMDRLKDADLKIKGSKCSWFRKQIKYLGHIASKDGLSTDPKKVEAVKEWPVPKRKKDIRKEKRSEEKKRE